MASSLYCNNNQVRDSCFSNASYGRSCSKAQASLQKILHLISTIPPPCEEEDNPNPLKKKRGFDIDLNLRLGSFVDDNDNDDDESERKSESLAENSFVGKNPDLEEEEIEEKTGSGSGSGTATAAATDVSSDVTEIQKSDEFKSGSPTDGEVKRAATCNDSLDLLIEAAEMISDRDYCRNDEDKEVETNEGGGSSMKTNDNNNRKDSLVISNEVVVGEEAFEEFEDISPVVRSKRGRSQVLPHRFRDSVLEQPWKKQRPQRPSTASVAVVSKKKKRKPSEVTEKRSRTFG